MIGIYGMGLTQHRTGVETVQMLVNLLLLRGNIGKPGAGICPVRGHSNVQGQRTVGITEKPELVPLDRLAQQYGFEPPREKGLNTVEACEAILDGEVRAFVSLGGNFVRAVPDRGAMEPAWRKLRLTVQIATKLNRSHLVHGEVAYLLPCLGRIEIDEQASGPQAVSIEDSTGCIHGSRGVHAAGEPAAAVRAGDRRRHRQGDAAAPTRSVDWDALGRRLRAGARRDRARPIPEIFHDFNARMWQPGGFHRPIARARAQVEDRDRQGELHRADEPRRGSRHARRRDRDVLRLITLRSNDQFNTTIYGYNDRFRGIHGTRMVVLMNRNDIARLGLHDGEIGRPRARRSTTAVTARCAGLRVAAYDIPEGCIAGYYPECNPLIPLWHHAKRTKVPAAKSVPVRIVPGSEASDTLDTSERRVNERLRFAARDVGAGAVVAAGADGTGDAPRPALAYWRRPAAGIERWRCGWRRDGGSDR